MPPTRTNREARGKYETTIWLDNEPDTLFVGLLIVKHRKVGGIEFI